MKIVVDVNVLFSALIKNSLTRHLLGESGADFYFPEPSLEKIQKYLSFLIEKSRLSSDEFIFLLERLLIHIHRIKKESLQQHWSHAVEIMGHIDEEDVIFIASALSLGEGAIIWSDDKHFLKQKLFTVVTTREIAESFFRSPEKR